MTCYNKHIREVDLYRKVQIMSEKRLDSRTNSYISKNVTNTVIDPDSSSWVVKMEKNRRHKIKKKEEEKRR